MASKTRLVYRELDLVPIPELGVKAGDLGVVDFIYDDGRKEGAWHVMAYSVFA